LTACPILADVTLKLMSGFGNTTKEALAAKNGVAVSVTLIVN